MTQNIIIMGAHGGTGENLAIRLAKAGYHVHVTMRQPDAASDALRAHAAGLYPVDVTDSASIDAAFSRFTDENPVAGFVYAIGSIDLRPFKSAKDSDFSTAFDINVMGAVRALRILEKPIKAAKGSVVLFSSIAAAQGFTNHTVIGSAKGAIEGFALSLASEWAGHARVNVIAPSLTDTAMAAPLTSSAPMRDAIEKMHPIPRLGTADDLAAAAQFLISPESGWITGQVIRIDGGRSTLKPRG